MSFPKLSKCKHSSELIEALAFVNSDKSKEVAWIWQQLHWQKGEHKSTSELESEWL